MYEDPDQPHSELSSEPAVRAREKTNEFRMHAELAAIFEGMRKFDAELLGDLDATRAREIQRTVAKLEKSKATDHPILPPESADEARALFALLKNQPISTNDYHLHRRPGEVMIVRWLEAEQVAKFYERIQAHYDVAIEDHREEEKQNNQWREADKTEAYLKALDDANVPVAQRYLREPIDKHNLFVLSTLAVDEMDILHLCDYLMGVPAARVVGAQSAPPEDPTEQDRSWFFKLFSLRGMISRVETMCFFVFLQKSDESSDW